MGSIIWDLPFSLMLGLKFVSNLIHTPMAEDLKVSKISAYINTDGIKVIKKSIITPTAPIRNAGYPNNLLREISDTPPNPAAMIRSMVVSSYIPIFFDISEI